MKIQFYADWHIHTQYFAKLFDKHLTLVEKYKLEKKNLVHTLV